MWPLLGIAVIIIGFVLRFNPLLVVIASALVTGSAAGLDIVAILSAFGKAFNDTRYISVVWIVLPVVALLEAKGLQERARGLIAGLKGATVGRLLTGYLVIRQATAALGLTSVAGHAQTVRPLVAPMAEAAAEQADPALTDAERERHRQCRAVLRRGYFHRHRLDPSDERPARSRGHHPRSVRPFGLGDPHRHRRFPDPRVPPVVA